jgi:hypothetical protein
MGLARLWFHGVSRDEWSSKSACTPSPCGRELQGWNAHREPTRCSRSGSAFVDHDGGMTIRARKPPMSARPNSSRPPPASPRGHARRDRRGRGLSRLRRRPKGYHIQLRQETAALRDFNPAYDRLGSLADEAPPLPLGPLHPSKRTCVSLARRVRLVPIGDIPPCE